MNSLKPQKQTVYCIPGLSASKSIFEYLPQSDSIEYVLLDQKFPLVGESFDSYIERWSKEIKIENAIVIVPSLYDNSAFAAQEAMCFGRFVVCSHNGGTKELVKDNGVVVQLEEDYEIGSRVPLYNPPKVDTSIIVDGILEVLEKPTIFDRPDLDIKTVAKNYEKI